MSWGTILIYFSYLYAINLETQNRSSTHPILISNGYEADESEWLLKILCIISEKSINAHATSIDNQEEGYLTDALRTLDSADRFALLNDELINVRFRKAVSLISLEFKTEITNSLVLVKI